MVLVLRPLPTMFELVQASAPTKFENNVHLNKWTRCFLLTRQSKKSMAPNSLHEWQAAAVASQPPAPFPLRTSTVSSQPFSQDTGHVQFLGKYSTGSTRTRTV